MRKTGSLTTSSLNRGAYTFDLVPQEIRRHAETQRVLREQPALSLHADVVAVILHREALRFDDVRRATLDLADELELEVYIFGFIPRSIRVGDIRCYKLLALAEQVHVVFQFGSDWVQHHRLFARNPPLMKSGNSWGISARILPLGSAVTEFCYPER